MNFMKSFFVLFIFFASHLSALTPDLQVKMPMRDGFEIETDLYFPKLEAKEALDAQKYPCVLVRHPLGRSYCDENWIQLVNEGYMVAVQSTRSSCDESGKSLPYVTDALDGHDAIEWLGNSKWCNGKVATVGASAAGITSHLLAPTSPSHLVCQYIEVAPPSLYQYAVWPGGQFRKEQVEGWLKAHRRAPSVIDWLHKQALYNDFWRQFNAIEQAEGIHAPQLHIGGWYDIFLQGTIDAFQAAKTRSKSGVRDAHKLIIGPWGHYLGRSTQFGDFAPVVAGKTPASPISIKTWLNRYMKEEAGTGLDAPAVQYFVMGPFDGTPSSGNRWRAAHKWPPDSIAMQMYLTHDGMLNSTLNPLEEKIVHVAFNPSDPVPTVGGRNLFSPDGPKDLQAIEKRNDVVVFTSAPLEQDLEVTGKLSACVYASNMQQERALCLRLTDVYPDGRSILIAEGVAHTAAQATDAMTPIQVDMWSTSLVFAKGHKIRLDISGSNFPAYEASLQPNTTDSTICFSIATGGKNSSFLSLPVVTNVPL